MKRAVLPMQFTADEYFKAGLERMSQAYRILKSGRNDYALAMYCGGLAVECLLRAFRWTKNSTFEGRHDLMELLRASEILGIDEAHSRRRGMSDAEIQHSATRLREAILNIANLWHNNLRFASEDGLKAFLKRIDRLKGIKGDPLKKNATDLLENAQFVMDRGATLWTSRAKSRKS